MPHPKYILSPNASLDELLSATKFAVEANGFEKHMLWRDHHKQVVWESNPAGYGIEIGKIGEHPVMLSVTFQAIDGHVVLFHHVTSQLVDYHMVEAWLKKNVPATWDRGHRIAHGDAMNFSHCLQALRELNAPVAEPVAQ